MFQINKTIRGEYGISWIGLEVLISIKLSVFKGGKPLDQRQTKGDFGLKKKVEVYT